MLPLVCFVFAEVLVGSMVSSRVLSFNGMMRRCVRLSCAVWTWC